MKTIHVLLVLILLFQLSVQGQNFSLKESVDYAITNNSDIKMSTYDQLIAKTKINQQIGTILPQINASGSLTDNFQSASSLSSKYIMSAGAQLDQKIYDPTFSAGLKAANFGKTQAALNLEQTKEQIVYSVCRTYYQTLIIKKQYDVLNTILSFTSETLKAIELKYTNGSAKKLDIDKIKVTYNNTHSQVKQAELNYEQSLNNLKCQMGIPVDSVIVLTDTLNDNPSEDYIPASDTNYLENRTDYKLLKVSLNLQETNKSNFQTGYLPSLSFNANYGYQSSQNEFTLIDDNWDANSSVGLSLSVPIFDGLQRHEKVAQSNYEISKAKENIKSAEQTIKVDISNYTLQHRIAVDNITNEKANLSLAEEVLKNTQLAYQQGTESSYELIQAESSMYEAQNNYFTTLLNFYYACIDLEQSKGNLMNFVNTLK